MSKNKKKIRNTSSTSNVSGRKTNSKTNKQKQVKKNNFLWAGKVLDFLQGNAFLVTVFLAFLLILFTTWDFFSLKYVFFFKDIGSDELTATYPSLVAQANQLKESFFTGWTFTAGMGDNRPSTIPTEPIMLLFRGVQWGGIQLFGSDFIILGKFHLNFLLPFSVTLVFSYLFFSSVTENRLLAIPLAIIFSFMGYMILGSAWGHARNVMQAAVVLYGTEQLVRHRRWVFFTWALALVSANAFYLFLFAQLMLSYSLIRFFSSEEKGYKNYGQTLITMIWSGMLGMLANLVNILPIYKRMFTAPRVAHDVATLGKAAKLDAQVIDNFPESVTALFRFFSNDILGNGSKFQGWYNYLEAPAFYISIVVLLLIPQFFALARSRARIVLGISTGFWFLAAFVPDLRLALQVWVGNYYKGVFNVLVTFHMILPAALGLKMIWEKQKVNVPVLGLTTLGLLVLLYFPFGNRINSAISLDVRMVVTVFVFLLTVCLAIIKYLNPKVGVLLLLSVIALETGYQTHQTFSKRKAFRKNLFQRTKGGYNDNSQLAVNAVQKRDSSLFFRMEKDFGSARTQHTSLNDAAAQGYYATASYTSFNQYYYIRFLKEAGILPPNNETATRWSTGVRGYPILMSFAGVKYFFTKDSTSSLLNLGFTKLAMHGDVFTLRNNFALPLAFTYDSIMMADDFRKTMVLSKQTSLMRACVVDSDQKEIINEFSQKRLALGDTLKGFGFAPYQKIKSDRLTDDVQMKSFAQNELSFKAKTDGKRIFFASIPYDMGWQAEVNGKEVETFVANFGFLGFILPEAGEYEISLSFQSVYFTESLLLSYFVIFVVLIIWFVARKRKKLDGVGEKMY